MFKITLFISSLMITGCSSVIKTDDLLVTNNKKTSVNIKNIISGEWFDPLVHKVEDISITHDDGVTTRGLHLSTKGSKYLIIYFGGNSFRIQDAGMGLTRRFAQLGVDFVWMDYRGIGASDGVPSIHTLKEDALDTNQVVKQFGKKVILHGVSMGSLIATNIAAGQNDVEGLVLEAVINDVESLVKGMAPSWKTIEVAPELRGLSNEKYIVNYEGPLMFIVGSKDTITPSTVTQRMYDISPSNMKKLSVIDDASHVNSMTFEQTFNEYSKFLENLD